MLSEKELDHRQDKREQEYLRAAAVKVRYGDASDMWLHRRLHDGSGFPKPIYIGRLRYWRVSDLIAWERARAAKSRC